jgi:hypothetical protein
MTWRRYSEPARRSSVTYCAPVSFRVEESGGDGTFLVNTSWSFSVVVRGDY